MNIDSDFNNEDIVYLTGGSNEEETEQTEEPVKEDNNESKEDNNESNQDKQDKQVKQDNQDKQDKPVDDLNTVKNVNSKYKEFKNINTNNNELNKLQSDILIPTKDNIYYKDWRTSNLSSQINPSVSIGKNDQTDDLPPFFSSNIVVNT